MYSGRRIFMLQRTKSGVTATLDQAELPANPSIKRGLMAGVVVLSSALFDQIATILVTAEDVGMASASLYRWYAKGFSYDKASLLSFTGELSSYVITGVAPERLVRIVADFPEMLSWFGPDIVHSEGARNLLREINTLVLQARETKVAPRAFVQDAERYLQANRVTTIVENLVGLPWPKNPLRLVVARHVWDPFYVMPDTVVCGCDDTFATYAVMIAHEGTHILTLDLVNDRSIIGTIPGPAAGLMAEALAQAVQMLAMDVCGISYTDLFPTRGIDNHEAYVQAHPVRARMAPMIERLMEALRDRRDQSLQAIYREICEEFARRS